MSPAHSAAELSVDALMALARSPLGADREKLLDALVAIHREDLGRHNARGMEILRGIFLELVRDAERELRLRLAHRLKDARWAPHEVVVFLANDEIEIARPVIAGSPLLADQDLLRLLVEATLEHKIEVARRPRLSEKVAEAIIEDNHPLVMAALAGNTTAEISIAQLSKMVEASRRMAALRSPLVRHPHLTGDLARALYAWVGESLRRTLEGRFQIDADAVRHAIGATVLQMDRTDPPTGPPGAPANEDVALGPALLDRESERQLVIKMEASGQLRPGYLLRCLKDGKLGLFNEALARLGGFPRELVDIAVASGRTDLLALACAAVGIDRSAFPAMNAMIEQLAGRRTGVVRALPGEVTAAFIGSAEQASRSFMERAHRLKSGSA